MQAILAMYMEGTSGLSDMSPSWMAFMSSPHQHETGLNLVDAPVLKVCTQSECFDCAKASIVGPKIRPLA